MSKVQFYATFWTLALAIPFTALALVGAAYLTNHLPDIAAGITELANWRGVALEGSARWPELAGMIIGQLFILSILLIARRTSKLESPAAV